MVAKGGGWTGAESEQEDRKCLEPPGELEMGVPEEASCGHRQREHPRLRGKEPSRTDYTGSGLREESQGRDQASQARHFEFKPGSSRTGYEAEGQEAGPCSDWGGAGPGLR